MSTKAKQEAMLEELESLAERLGVKVSYEALQGGLGAGGLCRVKGTYRVIMDKRTATNERVATLAQALGEVGVGDDVELSRAARDLIAHLALSRAS
jgi:hypothetical protein